MFDSDKPTDPDLVAPMDTSSFDSYLNTNPYATSQRELVKNEFVIGLGITFLGGAVGFAYGLYKNNKLKSAGISTIESDLASAFEGAFFGIVIAVGAILLYRLYFQYKATKNIAAIQAETHRAALQSLQAARLKSVAETAGSISATGHAAAVTYNILPRSLPPLPVRT